MSLAPPVILREDPAFFVFQKPADIPVHGHAPEDYLTHLRAAFPGEDALVPVHRLDAPTSGCLLVARNARALRALTRAFARREVEKTYLAEVVGMPAQEEGEVFTHLAPVSPTDTRMQVVEPGAGPAALTLFRVVEPRMGGALLELTIVTGKTHQIRVHLRHLGHPIRGDSLYGRPGEQEGRLLLHAWKLAFPHPVTGSRVEVVASAPF